VSSGIRFHGFKPFNSEEEIQLRKAILNRDSIADIKAIDISRVAKVSNSVAFFRSNESVLNVAVQYPAALKYLLQEGFDPNNKNIFHKTPLMYASQYNNYESTKFLVKAGAKVNAGTIIPDDPCNYSLSTYNMTPLYYAVRYAGKDVINLLIDNNASKFFRTNGDNGYPVDWLSRFDNENLSAADKQEIFDKLKLPDSDVLSKISKEINLLGEQYYLEMKMEAAAGKFTEAVRVYSENYRALNNLSLVLYKQGKMRASREASLNVVESEGATARQISSAYYNLALVCNKLARCSGKVLGHYLHAYETFPSKKLADSIVDGFYSSYARGFLCDGDGAGFERVFRLHNSFRFLHKEDSQKIFSKYESLISDSKTLDVRKRDISLEKDSIVDLNNGYYVASYISAYQSSFPFSLGFGVCTNHSGSFLPEDDKVIYIQSQNKKDSDYVKIDFDLDESYIIILSGDNQWVVSDRGKSKSNFILNGGSLVNSDLIQYSVVSNMHRPWNDGNDRRNRMVLSSIRQMFGKPIYTKFKITSNKNVLITDEDIHRAKIIVSPYANLEFHGIGDYQIAYTVPKESFNNLSGLTGVKFLIDTDSHSMVERPDDSEVFVSSVEDYLSANEHYYIIEKRAGNRGYYFGDGFFTK
jgi:ankyrin repeat protein